MSASQAPRKTLDFWIKQLTHQELPALGKVARELGALVHNPEAEASEIAAVILQDPNLTAKVLRVANSVIYHRGAEQGSISTVTGAVVRLGINGIRSMCLSLTLVDSLLKRDPRDALLDGLADAFHSAVQAREIARRVDAGRSEEVFIAALMYRVGELAFWGCRAKEVEQLQKQGNQARAHAEEVLGCSLESITRALAAEWDLGELLLQALDGDTSDPAAQAVILGDQISVAARENWSEEALEGLLDRVAAFTGSNRQQTAHMLENARDDTSTIAAAHGAAPVSDRVPPLHPEELEPECDGGLQPDPMVQLSILRELNSLIQKNVDLNTLFQTAMEGIHRGVGLRVALWLCDPRRTTLQVKFALGEGASNWPGRMWVELSKPAHNLPAFALLENQRLFMERGQLSPDEYTPKLRDTPEALLKRPAVYAPIHARNKPIGLIYADASSETGGISEEQIESVWHFAEQLNLALAAMAARR